MLLGSMMKFYLGRLVITPAALETIPSDEICRAIDRHVCGQWGDLSAADLAANELALETGAALRSVFHATETGKEFVVLTVADRTTTTVFLPTDSTAAAHKEEIP
jgi:hypothetical protein